MKNKRKTSLYTGSIIALIIIILPYFLYFNKNIPLEIVDLDTFLGTIHGGYYKSASVAIYWFFSKFVPFFLLFIWFITCKHWWAHAVLIPLSVYFFQLISVINDSMEYVDEVSFIYAVPITLAIVIILYVIRSKLAIFISAVDLKKEMDEKMGGDF